MPQRISSPSTANPHGSEVNSPVRIFGRGIYCTEARNIPECSTWNIAPPNWIVARFSPSEILNLPMPTLSEAAIADLLAPWLPSVPAGLTSQLSLYLDLLLKWNARTNLTAIRDPKEIVRRHFCESLFAARH